MAGIKHYAQIDMRVAPTAESHLVRLEDMVLYVAGKIKNPVRVVSTVNFDGTYDGGAKTLTQTAPLGLIVDGKLPVVGDRVLLAGQTDKTQNGIYVLTTAPVPGTVAAILTRATDFDESSDIVSNVKVPVSEGLANHDSTWVLTTDTLPIVLDSTNLEFARDSGPLTRVAEVTGYFVGDDVTSEVTFTHNLNSYHVTHEIYDDNSGETVVAQFQRLSANDAKVTLGAPLATGEVLTVILRAQVTPV
jgi:hypothetical protein